MKTRYTPRLTYRVGALLIVLAATMASRESAAVTIQAYYSSSVSSEQRVIVNAAIHEVEECFARSTMFALTIESAPMGMAKVVPGRMYILAPDGMILAFTDNFFPQGVNACPASARIVFNSGAPFHWGLGLPDASEYDGLTVARHELLHAIGFAIYYKDYADCVIGLSFSCGGSAVILSGPDFNGLSHVSDSFYPGDLMNPYLDAGERHEISGLDEDMVLCSFGMCYGYGHRVPSLNPFGLVALVLLLLGTALFKVHGR